MTATDGSLLDVLRRLRAFVATEHHQLVESHRNQATGAVEPDPDTRHTLTAMTDLMADADVAIQAVKDRVCARDPFGEAFNSGDGTYRP